MCQLQSARHFACFNTYTFVNLEVDTESFSLQEHLHPQTLGHTVKFRKEAVGGSNKGAEATATKKQQQRQQQGQSRRQQPKTE